MVVLLPIIRRVVTDEQLLTCVNDTFRNEIDPIADTSIGRFGMMMSVLPVGDEYTVVSFLVLEIVGKSSEPIAIPIRMKNHSLPS